ncbi:MAG: thrombospondin type 3 repeat-containing protein, partial [Pseudomonadota bacterium]
QLRRADAQHAKLIAQARQRNRAGSPSWTDLGPYNIGGRVLDIAWDPTATDTFYVATASSGLWKTTDEGASFQLVWPQVFAQAVGSVAVDSNGVVYAGVGEGASSGNNPTQGQKGVFVSQDGGTSWTSLGLGQSFRTGRVRISPADNNIIFVAASGPIWEAGGERGIYRTTDAGATWQLVLAGENGTTGGAEVFIDPGNPSRIYAVMWDHIRQASFRRLGGVGSGIFRSDDGGDSWARLTSGLPPQSADVGRIGLGMSSLDPSRLYATYIDATGFFTGFYRSDNGGDTWNLQSVSGSLASSQSSFGWWFGRTWVDPVNVNRVFVAGVPLMVSDNGGTSWTSLFDNRVGHVDQHAMAWHPAFSSKLVLGNDGGVFYSTANGVDYTSLGGQPFTQFYTVAVSQQNAGNVLGGTQDNRCIRNYPGSDPFEWNTIGCGDGLEVLINYLDDSDVFACSQRGSCGRYGGGGDFFRYSIGPLGSRRAWRTPLVFDPVNPTVLYYGAERVYRSSNSGQSFTSISPDLTDGDPFPTDNFTFGTISTIAPSTNPSIIYVGTDDANVWRTLNGGTSWESINSATLPERWVTKIAVDPADPLHLYITYNGYQAADYAPYVFESVDAGDSWSDITANLPQNPVNSIVIDALGRLFLATDLGVYQKYIQQTNWVATGANLPTAPTLELTLDHAGPVLYAATHGRGMWSLPVAESDTDGDGVADGLDNCQAAENPSQTDTDGDGYGNACDADFNNDCAVNFADLGLLREAFFGTSPLFDLNQDGVVNFADLAIVREAFFAAPGPSSWTAACDS